MTTETDKAEGEVAEATDAAAAGADAGTATEAVAAPAGGADGGTTVVRPENLPDEFWDDKTGLKAGDLVAAFRDMQAKEAARLADVPAEGEAYELALPEDVQVPEGLEVQIDKDDPLWTDVQAIAREAGLPKGEFGKLVGAFARYQIAAQEADIAAYVAEKGKLGANADTRITAAENWLTANLKSAHASALGRALIEADGVEAIEHLIRLKSGPVAATNTGAEQVVDRKFGDGWFKNMPTPKANAA